MQKKVLKLSADELQQIRKAVHEKQIFLVVYESTLSGIQYLDTLVGSLETPQVSDLYDNQPLSCAANNNSIAQAVDDASKSLGINRNSVIYCLML